MLRTLREKFIAEVGGWLPNPFPLTPCHKTRLYFPVSSTVKCGYRTVFQLTHFELDQFVSYIQAGFKDITHTLSTCSCPSSMLQISTTVEHHVKCGSQGPEMEGLWVPESLLWGGTLTDQGQSVKDQVVNIFSFVCLMIFVATTKLCHCRAKASVI